MDYVKLAIIAAIFSAGVTTGSVATYKIMHGQVLAMQLAIAKANAQADKTLSDAKERVLKATNNALLANNNLESAHATANQLKDHNTALLAQLGRLRDPHQEHSNSALPNNNNPSSNTANAAESGYLSRNLEDLLRSESKRADTAAIDKNTLLDFVKNNCGIGK